MGYFFPLKFQQFALHFLGLLTGGYLQAGYMLGVWHHD